MTMYPTRYTTIAVLGVQLLLMTTLVTGVQHMSLIFTQKEYEKSIPWDFPPNTDILQLYLMLPPCSEDQLDDVTCYGQVTWSNCSNAEQKALEYPFAFNQTNKSLFWERSFSEAEVKSIGAECHFNLMLQCEMPNKTSYLDSTAVIKVISSDPDNLGRCLQEKHQSLWVYENTKDVVIGNIAPLPHTLSESQVYYSIQPSGIHNDPGFENIIVNNSTGDMILQKYFDREALKSREIRFIIKCYTYTCDTSGSCQYADDTNADRSQILTINVLDVNDNGPQIKWKNGGVTEFLKSRQYDLSGLEQAKTYTIADKDSTEVNQYEAYMLGNESGIFEMSQPINLFKGYYSLEVTRKTNSSLIPELPQFAFDVVFTDVTFCHLNAEKETSKAVYSVKIKTPWETPVLTADQTRSIYFVKAKYPVYTTDPLYTRIITLRENISEVSLHNFEVNRKGLLSEIFNVTYKEGIIHVINTELLMRAGNIIQNLTIDARLKGPPANHVTVKVEIEIISGKKQNQSYSKSCSFHKTLMECSNHSAIGTNQCEWRVNTGRHSLSRTYETCSPSLMYCPNNKCDELESLLPDLCPQDCTVEVKVGLLNEKVHPPRGIGQGLSPCWCNEMHSCTCMELISEVIAKSSTGISSTDDAAKQTDFVTTSKINPPAMQKTPGTFCDTSCKMSILGAFLSIVLMIVVATLSCRMFRKKTQTVKLKHIASNVSLSAVTSDYHEEAEDHEEISDNRYAPIGVNLKLKADPKWEVSRQNVVLEKVLGEGEFGKVLKAQILDLPGKKGYSPAAVKMLKEQATIAEFRDLLSEYNLLKDVNHRNVIKLLGACTIKGPFMMIVEYCKHGSLKTYLLNCRCQGEVTESGCVIYKQHNSLGTLVPASESQATTPIGSPRHSNISTDKTIYPGMGDSIEGLTTDDVIAVLTTKDLISFAWQIANGMQYLNEMKVVHRDLAARNILVGTSKVVKISDFGLSRDIYMEDHYMKKSKGRVPVKWMAPESLYDHVYTSRSDVWSFGIVLWEIVTMGATPYPGVLPERLYSILKSGYRMTKPTGCSNQIFDIMSKCWQFEPMSRPSFKELSNIFEKMLKDKSDYLDLNSICNEDFSSSDDELINSFEAQRNLDNDARNFNLENINILSGEQEGNLIKSKSNYLVPVQSSGSRHMSPSINFGQLHQNGEELGRKSKHAFNPLYSSDVVNTPYDSPDVRQSRKALVGADNDQNSALLVPPDFNSTLDTNVHRSCPSLQGVLAHGQAPKGMICILKNGKVKNKTTSNRRGNESESGTKSLVYADIGSSSHVFEDTETEI